MNPNHVKATEEAIQYMRDHLDEDITSDQLAALVNYSPYHFIRVFKRVTGISPRQYLSALRIESGKINLLQKPSLLVKILLSIGFTSLGSFNTRFKQFVGLSPKQFRTTSNQLVSHMKEWEHKRLSFASSKESRPPKISCQVEAPESFRGIIFIGLFPRPIPDQKPIVGTALTLNNRSCEFSQIPCGTYYLLAAGIAWSMNPRDYFILDKSLRGMHESAIEVDETTDLNLTITLRDPLPYDPPIVVNLPLLLFEKKKAK